MSGAVVAIWPIALLIIVAIVGVPLWLTFRRKHVRPDYREAHAHYQAKRAREVGIKGRSSMSKSELINALRNH